MARSLSSPRMASSNMFGTLLSPRYIAQTYRADISKRYMRGARVSTLGGGSGPPSEEGPPLATPASARGTRSLRADPLVILGASTDRMGWGQYRKSPQALLW